MFWDINKQISLSYIPGIFQAAAFMLYLQGDVCWAVSLRLGTLFPLTFPALPDLTPRIFKVLGVKLCWLLEFTQLFSSGFHAGSSSLECLVWGSGPIPWHSSCLWTVSWVFLAPTMSLTLLNVVSSLHFAVESIFCQSSCHFLGYDPDVWII